MRAPNRGNDFDTHLVRNKRTGRIATVSSVALEELVATGEYQPVQIRMKHGPAVPSLSEVMPIPGHYILEVPGNDLISIPPDGDYYWRDQHLPTSEYANRYNRAHGGSWIEPSMITSAYAQWLKDYIAGKAEWSDMPVPRGGSIPPRPGG